MHWVLAEAEEVDPATAPLVVWYQGGPGASSLFGFFVEFGPFMLNDQSLQDDAYNKTGVPQLIRNPSSWNKVGILSGLPAARCWGRPRHTSICSHVAFYRTRSGPT